MKKYFYPLLFGGLLILGSCKSGQATGPDNTGTDVAEVQDTAYPDVPDGFRESDLPGPGTPDADLLYDSATDVNDEGETDLVQDTYTYHGAKKPLKGLVAMGSVSDLRKGKVDVLKEVRVHPDVYTGVVIHTSWGLLEPQKGTYDFSSIDNALQDIASYNKAHPAHTLGAKIRISKSINPPEWVLKMAGGPVTIVTNQGYNIPVGLYWTPEYRKAWNELQQKLAQRYDDNPLIREVCVNSGAMITDEPFIAVFNQPTIANLHSKGYTDEAFKATLEGALDDYAYWVKTPVDFSFNVFRGIDTGKPVNDMDFTLSLMKKFRKQYGDRAVISNHGLQENLSTGVIPIYQTFAELGAPIAVQTKGPKDLKDATFKTGLKYGVTEFELWVSKAAGGYADFTQDDLNRWKKMIDDNEAQ